MSFRLTSCALGVFALCLAGIWGDQAAGQVQSGGLAEPDLWTVGFQISREESLPTQSWAAADSDDLLTLTRVARTRRLSPVEQTLMRRLVLSAASAPESDKSDELLAERARLMFQIGEASAAAQLLPSLKVAPTGLNTDEVAVDLQLAIGETEAACLSRAGEGREEDFWVKLRAVCFTLEGRFEEAELAMELAASQGVTDGWLSNAIFAASGGLNNKPAARFDNGLSLAISAKAGLEPSISTIANSRLDLAAAIARQDTFSPAMRVQAAGVAAEAGLLPAQEHRALYKALIESEGFSPRTPLEVALHTTMKDGNDNSAKARTLRAALGTARGNPARFGAVSRLLLEDLEALRPSDTTARMATDFITASLAAGAPDEALRWAENAPGSDGVMFEPSWLVGIMVLAGADMPEDTASKTVAALMETAKTTKQKQAAARLFVLWDAAGIDLPAKARGFLADRPAPNKSASDKTASPYLLASIEAAARAQAGAELVFQALALTNGDAYSLTPNEARTLVKSLRVLGQEDAARMLAIEATGYWRKSL